MPRRETEGARSDGAGACEVGGVEGREVGEDGAWGSGGEEQTDGAVKVGGQEVSVRVGSGGRGAAEGFGHDFCFAEKEAFTKRASARVGKRLGGGGGLIGGSTGYLIIECARL